LGQKLDDYWENKVLKGARENDAYCKRIAKDPSKKFEGFCSNVSATVTSTLCNKEHWYTQCFAIQKERGLQVCRERLATLTNQPIKNTKGEDGIWSATDTVAQINVACTRVYTCGPASAIVYDARRKVVTTAPKLVFGVCSAGTDAAAAAMIA
jgi:hypothetical protein